MLVRRVLRVFWWCFAAVVVSLAVALSAARLLLPAYRGIATELGAEAVGEPFTALGIPDLRLLRAALPGSDWENDAAFMGEWTVLQAFTAFLLGETETAFSLGQQALDQLPSLSGFVREVNYILLADIYTSTDIGHVSQAVTCGQEALAGGLAGSGLTTRLYAADRLTRALVLQGQYQAAEAVFQQTFEAVRERGLVYAPILDILYLKYAMMLYELNRLAQAERFIRDGLSLSLKFGAPGSELWCRLLLR